LALELQNIRQEDDRIGGMGDCNTGGLWSIEHEDNRILDKRTTEYIRTREPNKIGHDDCRILEMRTAEY
jgi:hypothetical protein